MKTRKKLKMGGDFSEERRQRGAVHENGCKKWKTRGG